jgi:hypothetical protein
VRDVQTDRAMAAPTTQKSMRQSILASGVPFKSIAQAISPKSGLTASDLAVPSDYSKGGVVKKSGWAKVHKGERILPLAAQILGGKGKKTNKRPCTSATSSARSARPSDTAQPGRRKHTPQPRVSKAHTLAANLAGR